MRKNLLSFVESWSLPKQLLENSRLLNKGCLRVSHKDLLGGSLKMSWRYKHNGIRMQVLIRKAKPSYPFQQKLEDRNSPNQLVLEQDQIIYRLQI